MIMDNGGAKLRIDLDQVRDKITPSGVCRYGKAQPRRRIGSGRPPRARCCRSAETSVNILFRPPIRPHVGIVESMISKELQMGLLVVIVIFLLLFGGGYHGYRREYYGGRGFGLIGLILVVLLILLLFSGPRMGWYSY